MLIMAAAGVAFNLIKYKTMEKKQRRKSVINEKSNEKSVLRELKEKMIEYYNRHGVDTNDYQFKKDLYARLLLSDYWIQPVFGIQSTCTHNGEKSMCRTACVYRDISMHKISGILLSHEYTYIKKFGEQIELDIDDMIEDLIRNFEETEKL